MCHVTVELLLLPGPTIQLSVTWGRSVIVLQAMESWVGMKLVAV